MSYEAWRISYQSSEQAAQAAYAQLQAVSAAAKALSEATNEREADDAQEALEAAAGGDLNGIAENIIQNFLISYNTLPHATQNEFADINAYFDWWKAKRREDKKRERPIDNAPALASGYERQWYACRQCGQVSYRDYVPLSFSSAIMIPACGHIFDELEEIAEAKANKLLGVKKR